ncbi:MAG: hypothetical protein ACOCM7_03425, partial [Bacteroidales bacterium]
MAYTCQTRTLIGIRKQAPARKAKLVNAALRSAQGVNGAFAIVKAARRKDLGIIKKRKICSERIRMILMKNFTIKHFGKIIKEQIFTGLL